MDEKEKRTMKDDEYRALVEAGPTVVMVDKEKMLKLLDWAEFGQQASVTLRAVRLRVMNGHAADAMAHLDRRIKKAPELCL
jgi:hypothetical protein